MQLMCDNMQIQSRVALHYSGWHIAGGGETQNCDNFLNISIIILRLEKLCFWLALLHHVLALWRGRRPCECVGSRLTGRHIVRFRRLPHCHQRFCIQLVSRLIFEVQTAIVLLWTVFRVSCRYCSALDKSQPHARIPLARLWTNSMWCCWI